MVEMWLTLMKHKEYLLKLMVRNEGEREVLMMWLRRHKDQKDEVVVTWEDIMVKKPTT